MQASPAAGQAHVYNLGLKFDLVAQEHPDRPAILFAPDRSVSYRELAVRSARLARHLLGQGVRRGDIICISGMKTIDSYAGLLACLRLGAGYAMLDYQSPVERLARIVDTCQPKLLLLDAALNECVAQHPSLASRRRLTWGAPLEIQLRSYDDTPLAETLEVTGADVAYLMFTSGSTGTPKGAVISHGSVLNFADWARCCFAITSDDVLTGVNPLYFDNSVFDLYASLLTGAALASFEGETVRDATRLVSLVDQIGCTLWFSVPSLLIYLISMKALGADKLQSVSRLSFGGEGFPKPKLKTLYDWYGSRMRLINVYGPTECTCICSAYEIGERDFVDMIELAPLGRIAANFSCLILDGDRPVQDGDIGELCLLGPNVGKGYYNDPQRSAAAFVQNPLNSTHREVMYRTGDLVRKDPSDGLIRFVGRKDFQVKHMGYRIELQEIEAALNCLDYVSEAAVVHGVVNGLSRLEAMLRVKQQIGEQQVAENLRRFLPSYMIPQRFTLVDGPLPKNRNGKIDRVRIKELLSLGG